MRLAWAALALALAAPSPAAAAPFGELPSRPVSSAATCLRATGAPGELVRRTESRVQLLRAGPGGVEPVAGLPADRIIGCPRAAARPGGAGVLTYAAGRPDGPGSVVRAYVREPGAGWGPLTDVLKPPGDAYVGLATAISERGETLVAAGSRSSSRGTVIAARRAPGGAFGTQATLFSRRSAGNDVPTVQVGMSSTGEAVVVWAVRPSGAVAPRELWVSTAAPGAAFGAPRKLATLAPSATYDLTVGADGRALLAFLAGTELDVVEKPPGGAFGVVARAADATDRFGVLPAVALRADGGAVVAWSGLGGGDVHALVRDRPGAFGAPATVGQSQDVLANFDPFYVSFDALLFTSLGGEVGQSGATLDDGAGNLRAAITADGRAQLTWAGPHRRNGVWWTAPATAALSLTGGRAEVQALGGELRDAGAVTPAQLADGTPAVAWTDSDARDRHGRLHLAAEAAANVAERPAPRVRVGAPVRRVLSGTQSLVLPVTCSAACDVRAQLVGRADALGQLSLRAAGTGRLELEPTLGPIARLRGGPVRVYLRYGAPGARTASARIVNVQVRRGPSTALPKVIGARARRDGDAVVVTWRSDRPVANDAFLVVGAATSGRGAELLTFGDLSGPVDGLLRTSFSLRLEDARAVRWAVIVVGEYAQNLHRTTVRVRG